MIFLAVFGCGCFFLFGFIVGSWHTDKFNERYFKDHQYCVTCHQFGPNAPITRLERRLRGDRS